MLKLPSAQTSKGNGIFNGIFQVNIMTSGSEPTTPVKTKKGIYLLYLLVHVHFLLFIYTYIYI